MVTDQSAISRRSVGEWSATDWRSVGDWLATVSRAFFWFQKVFLEIGRQPIGDWSAISRRLKLCRDCLQPLQWVGNQSPTSWPPVGNLSATTKNLSTIDLVAERFPLQQPKSPGDQIVPATFCNRSATSRKTSCNRPVTSLPPPKFWSQGGRRLFASHVWPELNDKTYNNSKNYNRDDDNNENDDYTYSKAYTIKYVNHYNMDDNDNINDDGNNGIHNVSGSKLTMRLLLIMVLITYISKDDDASDDSKTTTETIFLQWCW